MKNWQRRSWDAAANECLRISPRLRTLNRRPRYLRCAVAIRWLLSGTARMAVCLRIRVAGHDWPRPRALERASAQLRLTNDALGRACCARARALLARRNSSSTNRERLLGTSVQWRSLPYVAGEGVHWATMTYDAHGGTVTEATRRQVSRRRTSILATICSCRRRITRSRSIATRTSGTTRSRSSIRERVRDLRERPGRPAICAATFACSTSPARPRPQRPTVTSRLPRSRS
jgi:hypothetical protein